MTETVVVATDGGQASHAAMDWVIDRALHVPTEVEVVSVEELAWLPVGADESDYLRRYDEILDFANDYLSHHRGISFVATRLLDGDPADAIAEAATLAGAVVLGSPRSSDDEGAPHGTLALRVAARTTARLTVVPAGWSPRAGGVVVGIAEDDSSDAALDAAIDEAVRTERDLVLVHAWELPAPFTIVEGLLKTEYPTLEALHRDILEQAAARATARNAGLEVRTLLKFGRPASVISAIARDEALVIVGSHHYGKLRQLFLGSVGHDVLLTSVAPVTVVPNLASSIDGGTLGPADRD